jgi:hypothetical protein
MAVNARCVTSDQKRARMRAQVPRLFHFKLTCSACLPCSGVLWLWVCVVRVDRSIRRTQRTKSCIELQGNFELLLAESIADGKDISR